ncbi:DUF3224 domain-containing protein [Ruoffia tabacinasalis]|nr:DUF3224 domain-containing protein [Ruoffia tabacinasalis]
MLVSTTGKVKRDFKQNVLTDNKDKVITVWNVSYEIRSKEITGTIEANYLTHQSEADVTPELIRGFAEFQGTIDGKQGSFTAQEDGRVQNNILKINGRIIDVSEELSMLVGRYDYDGILSESVYEINFDIEF